MDLVEDQNQSDPQIPPAHTTAVQTATDGVASEPHATRLTVAERLDRISKYRIYPTSIKSTSESGGRGGKGEVIQASFEPNTGAQGKRVAVKRLLWDDTEDEEKFSKGFVNEVELLANLSHENIVELVGFVEDFTHQKAWIVLSWEPNGNVREFLASGKWEIPERISLIKDMFDGLKYLHTRKPPICHGDLKSLNILVGSYYQAIITDFGSARIVSNESERKADLNIVRDSSRVSIAEETSSHPEVTITVSANQMTLTGPDWTLRWAAPELLIKDEPPNLASDVWSAGWVCWEMMTDRLPFDDVSLNPAIVWNVIQAKVPLIYEDAQLAHIISLCSLMKDCWKFEPGNRPHVRGCSDKMALVPSVRPEGGISISSDTKEPSTQLLMGMSYLYHSQGRHEQAASVLEQVFSTESAGDMDVAEALLQLGIVSTAQHKYTEAEESHARGLEIYTRIGSDIGQAYALKLLGDTYHVQSKYAEAREMYARAIEIYARIGADGGRAQALKELGKTYFVQCKYGKAEETYAQIQEIYARIGDNEGQADVLKRLGDIYQEQSKYAEAAERYTRALEVYARIGDDHGGADALKRLGDIYQAQSKYTEAEETYERALEVHARIGDEQDQVMTLLELGDVYWAQSKYAKAEETYSRVEEVYPPSGHDKDRAYTLRLLGETYHARSKYAEADETYTRALETYARIGDDSGRVHTLKSMGRSYRTQSKYTEAEEAYAQAVEIYASLDMDKGRAHTLRQLGEIYYVQSKYAEAEETYSREQEVYARIGDDAARADALKRLGDTYQAQSKHAEAEETYSRAQVVLSGTGHD